MQSHCDGTEEPRPLVSLVIDCLLPGPERGWSTTWHYMQSITLTYTPNKVAFHDSLAGPCATSLEMKITSNIDIFRSAEFPQ